MTNRLKNIPAGLPASAGFTLVETLVAILVLMMALGGPFAIAQKGTQATLVAKDQDSAFFLAQDAIEYIRWARDTNRLQNLNWLAGGTITINGGSSNLTIMTPCVSADGSASCYADSLGHNPTQPTVCSGACPALYYDTTNNRYTYDSVGQTQTNFVRTISIQTPVGGNASEAALTVTVSWLDPASHSITVREEIFNWQ